MKNKSAFTFLEITIVLLLISILAAAVMQGGVLVKRAKLANARSLTNAAPIKKINDLAVWLETTMPESFNQNETADNGSISTWYDLSNSASLPKNAFQLTATSKPTYIQDTMTGLPALYFDGVNDFMSSTENMGITGNPGFSIFVVGNVMGGAGWSPWINFGTPGTGKWLVFGKYSTSTNQVFAGFYSGGVYYNNPNNTNFAIHEWIRIGGGDSFTGNSVFINGVSQTFNNLNTVTPDIGNNILVISNTENPDGGSAYFNGYIGEIIIFSRALSDTERKDVENYLGKKWGITVS